MSDDGNVGDFGTDEKPENPETMKARFRKLREQANEAIEPPEGDDAIGEDGISNPKKWGYTGGKFHFIGDVRNLIEPGYYEIEYSDHIGVYFDPRNIKTDALIEFPVSIYKDIVDEIEMFWNSEPTFKHYGFLHKRGYLLYGSAGCLSGDSFIHYEIRRKDGKKQNGKGGSLELLYNRYNNIPRKGKGYYQRPKTIGSDFFVQAVNEKTGKIMMTKIEGVIQSGVKKLYGVTTEEGEYIETTLDHRYYVGGSSYKKLSELRIGDTVFMHRGVGGVEDKTEREKRPETTVKRHPFAKRKKVNGCWYHRIHNYRLLYEARMNDMSYDEFKNLLNSTKDINNLWFIPEGFEIHHKDEDVLNDSPENLQMVSFKEHLEIHREQLIERSRYRVVPSKIKEIKFVKEAMTYDIQCADPYHSFVANKFVVHNSGKSCLLQIVMRKLIERGGIVVNVTRKSSGIMAKALYNLKSVEPNKKLIVIFEDIDAIIEAGAESDLLAYLDGENNITNTINFATTNYPERLDKRIVQRPRRFDRLIKVPPPQNIIRRSYFKSKLKIEDAEIEDWVKASKGFSFAAMSDLVISVKCFGQSLSDASKRLHTMMKQRPESSEDFETQTLGFGSAGRKDGDEHEEE